MLNLAFIFHMHQPYYKNLLTQETDAPWVRLHGIKDYLDMAKILQKYPRIHQTFNLVPSLIEQLDDYVERSVKDKFWELSYQPAVTLTPQDKAFMLEKFFSINADKCISIHPRYYELYLKKQSNIQFDTQDYLDLQVWFNLAWFDPLFRQEIPELRQAVCKGRFFQEEDKHAVLDKQLCVLEEIIPVYKKMMQQGQIEVTLSPYYHPILPLLYNINVAKETNPRLGLPKASFSYPKDAKEQIDAAVKLYREKFGVLPCGMWPSEEAVSQDIAAPIIEAGINWIVADEATLFKSLNAKKRNTALLYQAHIIKRQEGGLNIVFRDRNLSDLIGFTYHGWKAETAADDFMKHLENINTDFKGKDTLVTVAMDGENAWEYYDNDGGDFLNALYERLSSAKFVKTVTVKEYLAKHPAQSEIKHLAAGSWIYAQFAKWVGSPKKNRAWECLSEARQELEAVKNNLGQEKAGLAFKQIYILEGSDWFWWYDDDASGDFDKLFRMHMRNFYNIMGKGVPDYLNHPI